MQPCSQVCCSHLSESPEESFSLEETLTKTKKYIVLKYQAFKLCACDPLKTNCLFQTREPSENIRTCVI